jgi:hypothetical protein
MANNSATSPLWNFPLPIVMAPSLNTGEQQQQQQSSSGNSGTGERKQRTLRLSINARERRRMHDLNDALDELRSVVCIIEFESKYDFEIFLSLDSLRSFTIRT